MMDSNRLFVNTTNNIKDYFDYFLLNVLKPNQISQINQ